MTTAPDKRRNIHKRAATDKDGSLDFIDKHLPEDCPKQYPVGIVLVAGMIFVFFSYLIFTHVTGVDASLSDAAAGTATSTAATQQTQTTLTPVANDTATTQPSSAFLGVEVMSIDDVMARALNLSSKSGVLVNKVVANSPAQIAGLKRGDVIVSVNTKTVKDVDSFQKILSKLAPGDTIRILYNRNGTQISTYAHLIAMPALKQTAGTLDSSDSVGWGASLSPTSPAVRDAFGIPSSINGVVISSVEPGGIADAAGLKPGDVITGVDKTVVTDIDSFFNAIAADTNNVALLDVYSQGVRRFVPIDSSSIKLMASTSTEIADQSTISQKLSSLFGGSIPVASTSVNSSTAIIQVEHTNEEDGYEKPVCKRLEETGERYENNETAYNGEI
jgi:membrane-associated protease RseP (regulator of RpoE activity)